MNNNLVFPEYDHSLLTIPSSILKYYGIDLGYKSNQQLDERFKEKPKNVVFILVDALGTEILKKHPEEAEFLIKHQSDVLTTVFPSTTTSATTSALTGLPPVRTGWIGWQQFIQEEKRHVVFFMNKDYYDEKHEFTYNISERFNPINKLYDLIQKQKPHVYVHEIFPKFKQENHHAIQEQVNTCLEIIKNKQENFIYMYWDQVDSILHDYGTTSKEVNQEIGEVNQAIKHLFESVDDDTLIILTADHGQIDIEPVPIYDYPDIIEMLAQKPAIEARATAFYVKDNYKEQFPQVFNKYFRDKFVLYTSDQILEMKLFGEGKAHPRLKQYLGDYFSIAIDRYAFNLLNKKPHKATHAGLTKDEMLIPLIINDSN
jgi:predicted AlkP superfamily pyrophosphatase or phosphodiesterase